MRFKSFGINPYNIILPSPGWRWKYPYMAISIGGFFITFDIS